MLGRFLSNRSIYDRNYWTFNDRLKKRLKRFIERCWDLQSRRDKSSRAARSWPGAIRPRLWYQAQDEKWTLGFPHADQKVTSWVVSSTLAGWSDQLECFLSISNKYFGWDCHEIRWGLEVRLNLMSSRLDNDKQDVKQVLLSKFPWNPPGSPRYVYRLMNHKFFNFWFPRRKCNILFHQH